MSGVNFSSGHVPVGTGEQYPNNNRPAREVPGSRRPGTVLEHRRQVSRNQPMLNDAAHNADRNLQARQNVVARTDDQRNKIRYS